MNIPVYIFTGFLESGKTRFIKDTLLDPGFTDGEKTLLVVCEDGEEEYSKEFLQDTNCVLLNIGSIDDFKGAALKKAALAETPDRIVLEYNGMWDMSLVEQEFPANWEIFQIVTTVNAETYEVFLKNMGPKIIEHVGLSELVVFNRCTPELKEYIRSTSVNAMNPRAIIFLEDINGSAENYYDGLPLPFDINAPIIKIDDADFGTWYVDAVNSPDKYNGKKIKFKALLHKQPADPPDRFAAGRFAMVCCADDISYIAVFCKMKNAADIVKEEAWATLTATVTSEYVPEFQDDAPVLLINEFQEAEPPEEDLIYFR